MGRSTNSYGQVYGFFNSLLTINPAASTFTNVFYKQPELETQMINIKKNNQPVRRSFSLGGKTNPTVPAIAVSEGGQRMIKTNNYSPQSLSPAPFSPRALRAGEVTRTSLFKL